MGFGFSRNEIMGNRGASRPDFPPKVDTRIDNIKPKSLVWESLKTVGVDPCAYRRSIG